MKSQLEIDVDLELRIHRVARRKPPNTLYERDLHGLLANILADNLNVGCASLSRGCELGGEAVR